MIHRLVVLAMLFGILGCGNDADPAPGERVARRDSAGVEIVDNPATPTWAPEEVWSVE